MHTSSYINYEKNGIIDICYLKMAWYTIIRDNVVIMLIGIFIYLIVIMLLNCLYSNKILVLYIVLILIILLKTFW